MGKGIHNNIDGESKSKVVILSRRKNMQPLKRNS
jgi:hypothetical protein